LKVVLDTTILVRAHEHTQGLPRQLLLSLVESSHTILLSNEMLHELARVLRYPRLKRTYGLSEEIVYSYVSFLREVSHIVILDTLLLTPIRDTNDLVVMQTAILGEADVLCSKDNDFFTEPVSRFLKEFGVIVVDDIELMQKLRA
jgi:uncharacterized protein